MLRSVSCICLCLFMSLLCAEDRPWLGITPDVTPGFDNQVLVKTVKPDSTASEMGLKPNDIITDLSSDKQTWKIKGIDDLSDALNRHKPGDTIRIGVKRGEEALTLQGILKTRPQRQNFNKPSEEIKKQIKQLGEAEKASGSNAALALSLHGLSQTLEQLPEKIEEAAREFKEVYPDGEFILKVEISISSNKLNVKTDGESSAEDKEDNKTGDADGNDGESDNEKAEKGDDKQAMEKSNKGTGIKPEIAPEKQTAEAPDNAGE